MELNLIIPEKRGGQYYFDDKCESDMREVLDLKKMNFSLQEIKEIFHFKRVGKLTSYQKNNYYQSLYEEKTEEIKEKITELSEAKNRLEEKLIELETKNINQITIGLDLSALSLFSCQNCNGQLLLSAERVEANQVIEGSLKCECGETLQIKNGILYTDNFNKNLEQIEDNHIEQYIKSTDSDFMDKSYQSIEWMQRHIEFENLSGKVIMDPGSGYGHFLRQVYERLPADTIYICIDNKPQVNQYLKKLLEMTGKRAKIIFITANLPELPLKDNVVDYVVDFAGTSSFSFDNKGFLPELIDNYLKKEITLLATFIIYYRFGPNNIVQKSHRENFIYTDIRDNLLKLGYKFEKESKSKIQKIQESPGKYERFAQPGDQIYSYQIEAKRWS